MAAPSSGRETLTSTEELRKSFDIKLGHSHVCMHTHMHIHICLHICKHVYTHMCTHEHNENTVRKKKASSSKSICPCTPEMPFQFKHQTRHPLEALIFLGSLAFLVLFPNLAILPEVIFWFPTSLWSLILEVHGPMYMPRGHSALVTYTDGISRASSHGGLL